MKTKLLALLTLTTLALTASAITAYAGHRTFPKEETGALMEPVKSVLDHYLKIQSALARESTVGITFDASAIANIVRDDPTKSSAQVAKDADILARVRNLSAAREAFKPLSKSLIVYLKQHNVTTAYMEVYCPMAKASWLQKGDKIDNPYLGGSMRSCGQIQGRAKHNNS